MTEPGPDTTESAATDYVIAIPIYQGVDLMDVAAPYEIFNWLGASWTGHNVRAWLVAETLDPVNTRDSLLLTPQKTFAKMEAVDLLWIPGGEPDALIAQMGNPSYVEFIQSRSRTAHYVTSVCEGALIAANAGLLDGYKATTHWNFVECLKKYYPNVKVCEGYPRYVHDRNRVTGGGISSGLDEALYLVKIIAGEDVAEDVQRTIQYFPNPPVCSSLPSSSACIMDGRLPVRLTSR